MNKIFILLLITLTSCLSIESAPITNKIQTFDRTSNNFQESNEDRNVEITIPELTLQQESSPLFLDVYKDSNLVTKEGVQDIKIDPNLDSATLTPPIESSPSSAKMDRNQTIQHPADKLPQDMEGTSVGKKSLFKQPVDGKVLTKFGEMHDSDSDDGIFYQATNDQIKSAADGTIIYIDGEDSENSFKTVIIKHSNDIVSSYTFNGSTKGIGINKHVKCGQEIGRFSPTGKKVTYFVTKQKGKIVNPEKILSDFKE